MADGSLANRVRSPLHSPSGRFAPQKFDYVGNLSLSGLASFICAIRPLSPTYIEGGCVHTRSRRPHAETYGVISSLMIYLALFHLVQVTTIDSIY